MQRQKTEHSYIEILKDSLKSKIQCLESLIKVNNRMESILRDDKVDSELFEEIISEKGAYITKLNQLDDGFVSVYERVRDTLKNDKVSFKGDIEELKGSIRIVTELTLKLEKLEKDNKELFDNRYGNMTKEIKKARTSNKVAANYYQSMAGLNVVEPQFMDKKK